MYVIFCDVQAYPEYLISIQRKNGREMAANQGMSIALSWPTHWAPMTDNGKPVKILLNRNDQEFRAVQKLFFDANLNDFSLLNVYRIQNPFLFQSYQIFKKQLQSKYQGRLDIISDLEKTLFHGTAKESVEQIYSKFFNRGYCGKNASAYGQGVYFARDLGFSANDTSSKPDPITNEKAIFVCKVLVGESCQGDSNLRDCGNYESAVDNIGNPSVYVIFCDVQAYPEYLIIIQKKTQKMSLKFWNRFHAPYNGQKS